MKLAIQGSEGSYHEQAAWQYATRLGETSKELSYERSFADVFNRLRGGECHGAIIAIANNTVGYIHDPYRTLVGDAGENFAIAGETYVRVEHQLLGLPGATIESITHVHSQAPALGQCEDYLRTQLPDAHREEEADTALSAKIIAEKGDISRAAIASKRAAKLYGLRAIATNIQDDVDNITRFLHVVPRTCYKPAKEANKMTALMTTKEEAGSLHKALGYFAERGIGITSLQSLYIPNSAFRMQFWIDVDADENDSRIQGVTKALGDIGCSFTILGSYSSEDVPLSRIV